jgi:hypothetical protein
MGVRGPPALIVLVVCALVYRQRSQVRPETLGSVLLALQLWLLSTRRGPGRRDWAFVLVALDWVNVHVSWLTGVVVLALHAIASHAATASVLRGLDLVQPRRGGVRQPVRWHAAVRPFQFLLFWRHDPCCRASPSCSRSTGS